MTPDIVKLRELAVKLSERANQLSSLRLTGISAIDAATYVDRKLDESSATALEAAAERIEALEKEQAKIKAALEPDKDKP